MFFLCFFFFIGLYLLCMCLLHFSLMSVVISVLPSKLTSKSCYGDRLSIEKRHSRAHVTAAAQIEWKHKANNIMNIESLGCCCCCIQECALCALHKETTDKRYKDAGIACFRLFFPLFTSLCLSLFLSHVAVINKMRMK